MESIRLSTSSFASNTASLNNEASASLMGMKTTNNHLGQTVPGQPGILNSSRMPDPSNNLTLLNQQSPHMLQQSAAPVGVGGSKLFYATQLENRDELDEKHDRCFNLVMACVSGKSEKEAIDALTVLVGKDPRAHEDVCLGLVVIILTSPSASEGELSAKRCYRDLTLICRDGLSFVLSHLTHIILEKYLKLMPHVKNQFLWLVREMVRASVTGMDSIVWNLMRQIAGGDVGRGNLWLVDSLLDVFVDHRAWLEKFPFLVASVTYTYLRLIEDHVAVQFEKLREKEVKFVVGLIRDRFTDVMTIGRDFVRILQNVAKIPEMSELWRDLLNNPRTLSPTFSGLPQLMETRTSRRFLQCRITPEMEKKLVFLTSQVKFGSHKRYQDWFQRQYLSTQESQSLRCDLIRFIVGVIHPTNELLCSDIIPRWAVIGWLLTTCTSQVAASNAKLALFYDWLFFQLEKDNIMNIEPAILVMHHSIKPHPAITATLLDFLCRIITNFFPKEQEKVRNGIFSSLKQILEKRVLPSLSPLFDNPKLDKELKILLRERFTPFVDTTAPLKPDPPPHIDQDIIEGPGGVYMQPLEDLTGLEARFSDDEIDVVPKNEHSFGATEAAPVASAMPALVASIPPTTPTPPPPPVISDTKKVKKKKEPASRPSPVKNARKRPVKQHQPQHSTPSSFGSGGGNQAGASAADVDFGESVSQLLLNLKSAVSEDTDNDMAMQCRSDEEEKCEIMDQLIHNIISEDFSFEQCNALASRLSEILRPSFEGKLFPASGASGGSGCSIEALEDSVGKPLFVAFRALCDMADGPDEGSGIVLQVLADLYALQPRVGYYLLYFLSVDKQAKERESRSKAGIYADLCETIDANYCLDICLVNDMRQCQEDDVQLFVHLVPDIYTIFPKTAVGNVNLIYLVVSCVDSSHLQQLVCHILAKDLLLFKKDSFSSIVTGSLSWETFEQLALWQLISAHDVPIDCFYSILPKLNFEKHAEALTAALLRLRTERPNADLVRHILQRDPVPGDRCVTTCLSHWLFEYEDKLADLVTAYLSKQTSSSSSGGSGGSNSKASSADSSGLKRKRGAGGGDKSSNRDGGSYSTQSSLSRKAEVTLTHLDMLRQSASGSGRQYEFFSHPNLQKALRSARQLCSDEQKKKFMDLFALAETDSDMDDNDNDDDTTTTTQFNSKRKNASGTDSRKSRKSRVKAGEDSPESSESDSEDDDKPLSSSRSKHRGAGGGNSNNSKLNKNTGNNSNSGRKSRPQSKNSYKGMLADSSENSSDEESTTLTTLAKKKKRRKKAEDSD